MNEKPAPVGRRLIQSILLVVSLTFGLLIWPAIFSPFRVAISQIAWETVDCSIEKSEVTGTSPELHLEVVYRYSIEGVERTGTTYSKPSTIVPSDADLRRIPERHPVGSTAQCFVNPRDPGDIVMETESLGVGFMLILPLVFILIGVLGLKFVWFPAPPERGRRTRAIERADETEGRSSRIGARLGLAAFFGLFMLVGGGLTYLFFLNPYLAVRESKSWPENQCKITKSEIHTSVGDKDSSTSYSVDIRYEYYVTGRKYVGDTYGLAEKQSSNYESKRAIVNKLHVGDEVPCYVDPHDPFRVTIARDIPKETWAGLFPMIFFIAGLWGFFHALGSLVEREQTEDRTASGTRRIQRRAQSRFRGFIGLIAITTIWNGIVGMVGYGIWESWHGGIGWFFPLVIVIPFALVGLLLIVALPYSFLQIFNPTLDLSFSDDSPQPGSSLTVSWRLNGSSRRIRRLEIKAELIALPNDEDEDEENNDEDDNQDESLKTSESKNSAIPKRKLVQEETLGSVVVISSDRQNNFEKGSVPVLLPSLPDNFEPDPYRKLSWRIDACLVIPWYPDSTEHVELRCG